ncbi:MAG: hypothetical protein Q9202_006689 [Teloschistes flavicans]
MVSDVVTLLLPAKTVWELRIPRRKKIKIMALFATGLLACIASAMLVFYAVRLFQPSSGLSFILGWMICLVWVELSLGISVACILTLPKLVEAKGKKVQAALSSLARPFTSVRSFKNFVRSNHTDTLVSHGTATHKGTVHQLHTTTNLTCITNAYKLEQYPLPNHHVNGAEVEGPGQFDTRSKGLLDTSSQYSWREAGSWDIENEGQARVRRRIRRSTEDHDRTFWPRRNRAENQQMVEKLMHAVIYGLFA